MAPRRQRDPGICRGWPEPGHDYRDEWGRDEDGCRDVHGRGGHPGRPRPAV